jgi:hypothetical protein
LNTNPIASFTPKEVSDDLKTILTEDSTTPGYLDGREFSVTESGVVKVSGLWDKFLRFFDIRKKVVIEHSRSFNANITLNTGEIFSGPCTAFFLKVPKDPEPKDQKLKKLPKDQEVEVPKDPEEDTVYELLHKPSNNQSVVRFFKILDRFS